MRFPRQMENARITTVMYLTRNGLTGCCECLSSFIMPTMGMLLLGGDVFLFPIYTIVKFIFFVHKDSL